MRCSVLALWLIPLGDLPSLLSHLLKQGGVLRQKRGHTLLSTSSQHNSPEDWEGHLEDERLTHFEELKPTFLDPQFPSGFHSKAS